MWLSDWCQAFLLWWLLWVGHIAKYLAVRYITWVKATMTTLIIVLNALIILGEALLQLFLALALAVVRSVVAKAKDHIRAYIWTLWSISTNRSVKNGVVTRLKYYASLSWSLSKGRSIKERLVMAFDFLRALPSIFYTGLPTLCRPAEHSAPATAERSSPATDEVYFTPNLIPLPDGDDDDDDDISDISVPEGLVLDFGAQPTSREQYIQELINQEHLDEVYAQGLLDDEPEAGDGAEPCDDADPGNGAESGDGAYSGDGAESTDDAHPGDDSDSGDEQEFLSSPETPQKDPITGPDHWNDDMPHQAPAA